MARQEPVTLAVVLWGAVALAQPLLPPSRTAPPMTVTARIHLFAHEALGVDALRALARPGVTLWLATEGNTLKDSTLENVARFDTAWVQVHAPLAPGDARVWARVPRAGAWVTPATLSQVSRLPGARRVAVQLDGPITDELAATLLRARVDEVRWAPSGPPDVLSWGRFRALGGRRVVALPAGANTPQCEAVQPQEPSRELHLGLHLAGRDAFPCGAGRRVVVPLDTEAWLVKSLPVQQPSLELVFQVGDSAALASQARALLDSL